MPTPISISNSSFDDRSVGDGTYRVGIDGWASKNTASGTTGIYNPTNQDLSEATITGSNVAYIESGSAIYQTLSTTYDSTQLYEFTIDVGDENASSSVSADYEVNLYAGGILIGTVSGNTGNINALTEVTLTSADFDNDPFLDGQPLTIEIKNTGTGELFVDNVQGEFAPIPPDGIVDGTDGDDVMGTTFVDV